MPQPRGFPFTHSQINALLRIGFLCREPSLEGFSVFPCTVNSLYTEANLLTPGWPGLDFSFVTLKTVTSLFVVLVCSFVSGDKKSGTSVQGLSCRFGEIVDRAWLVVLKLKGSWAAVGTTGLALNLPCEVLLALTLQMKWRCFQAVSSRTDTHVTSNLLVHNPFCWAVDPAQTPRCKE